MYRVDRNNFYKHEKKATIFTPAFVSEFLFDLLAPHIDTKDGTIIDPYVGKGSLEFISIKPSVAMASDARENYAAHSKLP
jgi:type I restriction-modification system DNA methylase subunit